jgi:hypothetical protein
MEYNNEALCMTQTIPHPTLFNPEYGAEFSIETFVCVTYKTIQYLTPEDHNVEYVIMLRI